MAVFSQSVPTHFYGDMQFSLHFQRRFAIKWIIVDFLKKYQHAVQL